MTVSSQKLCEALERVHNKREFSVAERREEVGHGRVRADRWS